MKRSVGRLAFVLVMAAGAIAIGIVAGSWFPTGWGGGLGGGFGAVAILTGGKLFDRIWPARKPGWVE